MSPADRPSGRSRSSHPAVRRDAEGNLQIARNWESLTERLIREAQERGEFDDLPAHGHPITIDDNHLAGDMAVANHVLRNAGMAPVWIEADKEARSLAAERDALLRRAPGASLISRSRQRAHLIDLVEAHRRAVGRLNTSAPSVRQHRRAMDLETELEALERAWHGRVDHPPT
jgi:hypothetical protein